MVSVSTASLCFCCALHEGLKSVPSWCSSMCSRLPPPLALSISHFLSCNTGLSKGSLTTIRWLRASTTLSNIAHSLKLRTSRISWRPCWPSLIRAYLVKQKSNASISSFGDLNLTWTASERSPPCSFSSTASTYRMWPYSICCSPSQSYHFALQTLPIDLKSCQDIWSSNQSLRSHLIWKFHDLTLQSTLLSPCSLPEKSPYVHYGPFKMTTRVSIHYVK